MAEVRSEIAGWVAFGPSRDSDAASAAGEIEAIYVRPDYWATGVGRGLWLVARRRLIERGFSSATLWVLSENARAIRFYRAAGFQPDPDSEKEISIDGKILKEIRYRRVLD